MAIIAESLKYSKTWLTDFFHGFPHLDFSLQETDSTFDPENQEYRKSLLVLCGFPIIWCAFLWLCFLVFFCVRCCKGGRHKQGKAACYRFFAGLFLMCGCASLAVAFYGNAKVHSGVDGFVQEVNSVNRTIESALNVFKTLDGIVSRTETKDLPDLLSAISSLRNATVFPQIKEFIDMITNYVGKIQSSIADVRNEAQNVNTKKVTDTTETFENYRWTVTISLYSVYIAIFLFAFTGLIKKSRCMLILLAIISISFLLLMYATMSAYLAIAVASSDLCLDPDSFVIAQVNGTLQQDVLQAFIKCDGSTTPYQDEIQGALTNVVEALTTLNQIVNATLPFNMTNKISVPVNTLRQDLRWALDNVTMLSTMVGDCDVIHNQYVRAVTSVCNTMLIGVAYEVLATALVALCSALLVLFAAFAWPYFINRRSLQGYLHVDNTDPFLPNDSSSHEHNYGSLRQTHALPSADVQRSGFGDDGLAIPHRDSVSGSAPPAYQSVGAMQQYHNLAPTPNSFVQSSHMAD